NLDKLKDDLLIEFAESGIVKSHLYKGGDGLICLEFERLDQAVFFQATMCSRWYNFRMIEALFVDPTWLRAQLTQISESSRLRKEGELLKAYIFEVSSLADNAETNQILNLAAVGLLVGFDSVLEDSAHIIIGGLPYHLRVPQIRELLESSIGPLRRLYLVKYRKTQSFKGIVFCVYRDILDTDVACAVLSGIRIGDTALTARRVRQRATQPDPEQENVLLQAQRQLELEIIEFLAVHALPTEVVCLSGFVYCR
ncbi:hypothetical protein MKX01_008011, partial [Papaver californicum]